MRKLAILLLLVWCACFAGDYQDESIALFARMTPAPNADQKWAIDSEIRSLKESGVWDYFYGLWIIANYDGAVAVLDWANEDGNLTLVNAPTFTPYDGYSLNGSTQFLRRDPIDISTEDYTIGMWVDGGRVGITEAYCDNNSDVIGIAGITTLSRGSNEAIHQRVHDTIFYDRFIHIFTINIRDGDLHYVMWNRDYGGPMTVKIDDSESRTELEGSGTRDVEQLTNPFAFGAQWDNTFNYQGTISVAFMMKTLLTTDEQTDLFLCVEAWLDYWGDGVVAGTTEFPYPSLYSEETRTTFDHLDTFDNFLK